MKRKFLSVLVVMALVLGMSLVTAVPAMADPGTTHYVATTGLNSNDGTSAHPWQTIQYAVTTAAAGDTINVAAGIYIEVGQLHITNNLTIVGADKANTIIKPAQDTGNSGDARGWFLVNAGTTFKLSNVTLDGTGHLVYMGLYYWGNGTVVNCNITNIKYNESTDYDGRGIIIKGNVDVSNSTFTAMGRIGVQYYGGSGTASNNTFVGKGDGDWLDYAFDIGNGAIVTIDHNTVSGNTGVALSDSSSSAAVVVDTYFGLGTTATITNNNLNNNTIGIAVGINGADASHVTAHNNNLAGNTDGVANFGTLNLVDATNNWWNSNTGPTCTSNAGGKGDAVSDNVTYTPWLTLPSSNAVTMTGTSENAIAPTVTTGDATVVAFTLATLNGNLTVGTGSVNVSFGYDTISHSGSPSAYPTWTPAAAAVTGNFSATIPSGLTPGVTYYFAARAQGNDVATPVYGAERSFTTAKITTLAATGIGAYTATLNGHLDIGSATSVAVSFGYSTDTTYGTTVTVTTPMTTSGNFSFAILKAVHLALEGVYNFRAVGNISGDIVYGDGLTVTLVPVIGISVSPTSINFGSIIAGHSSATQTVTVTNTGDYYDLKFTATLANESTADFYKNNLKIDTLTVSNWKPSAVAINTAITPGLVLSIPIGTTAGAKTATIIFWAESSTPTP